MPLTVVNWLIWLLFFGNSHEDMMTRIDLERAGTKVRQSAEKAWFGGLQKIGEVAIAALATGNAVAIMTLYPKSRREAILADVRARKESGHGVSIPQSSEPSIATTTEEPAVVDNTVESITAPEDTASNIPVDDEKVVATVMPPALEPTQDESVRESQPLTKKKAKTLIDQWARDFNLNSEQTGSLTGNVLTSLLRDLEVDRPSQYKKVQDKKAALIAECVKNPEFVQDAMKQRAISNGVIDTTIAVQAVQTETVVDMTQQIQQDRQKFMY